MYAVPELTVPDADIARWGSPASLAMGLAAHPERWWRLLDYRSDTRWYRLLERTEQHEVWLLSWLPGQGTDLHDHGPASGAFAIAAGTLTERVVAAKPDRPPVEVTRALSTGRCRAFGPRLSGWWPVCSTRRHSFETIPPKLQKWSRPNWPRRGSMCRGRRSRP